MYLKLNSFFHTLFQFSTFVLLPFVASMLGYGVLLYIFSPVFFILALIQGASILRSDPSIRAFCTRTLIVSIMILLTGVFGHALRIFYSYSTCYRCEPIIDSIEKYKEKNGFFPSKLASLTDFIEFQEKSGLIILEGENSSGSLLVGQIESCDAMIHLDKNWYSCMVPITKKLPMSFTRFYVFRKSDKIKSWTYEKIMWYYFSQ